MNLARPVMDLLKKIACHVRMDILYVWINVKNVNNSIFLIIIILIIENLICLQQYKECNYESHLSFQTQDEITLVL